MEEEKATITRILNLLTTKKSDDQRGDHLNIIKYFLLKNTNQKDIISKVNKSLSVASTRDRGLELLSELLEFLPVEIVRENAVFWITIILGQHPKKKIKPLGLGIIGRLIDSCSNIPEFKKIVVADYLAEIIQACLKAENSILPQHSLACLTTCLLRFASSCLPFKNNIETTLTKCLDYDGEDLDFVKKAATAFHYMNQIGGAGTDGITHQNNWTKQIEKLSSEILELLAKLNSETNETDFARSVAKQIRNCVIFVKTMLEKSYPVAKIVPIETLLNVINKGLDNHECISGVLLAKAEGCSVVARLQVDFLFLLRSFIACLQQRLTPFALTINKLLMNYLKRIHFCDCFKSSNMYSIAVYKVLRFWLKTVRNSFHCSFHERLIRFIIDDISPVEQKLTLQLSNTKTKDNKKKRNINSISNNTVANFENKDSFSVKNIKEDVCLQALETLETLLESVYLQINFNLTNEVYTILTKTLINIQGGKVAAPYTNLKCQLYLYRATISIFNQPYLSAPPPLSLVIRLLTVGQNSQNRAIASVCEIGLSKLESLCQPVCPTLYVGNAKIIEENKSEEEIVFDEEEEEVPEKVGEKDEGVVEAEKIHIISDIVIKPAENGKTTTEKIMDCKSSIETEIEITELVGDELKTTADDSDICVIEEDGSVEEETVELNGENVVQQNCNEIIEIFDEPPSKKPKTDEDSSSESMLDSFVNVVNDY